MPPDAPRASGSTPPAASPPHHGADALLAGWGRAAASRAEVVEARTADELAAAVRTPPVRGLVARGLGRSYGDAAQNAGGRVVDATRANRVLAFDATTGVLTAEAGASLDELLRFLVPQGFFVPVSPGTRYVTVGGAVASDIHGKNHHHAGSWCDHVDALELATPDGTRHVLGPDRDPEAFWATAGGMGLTGVLTTVTFRCPPIPSSRVLVDTDRVPDLDALMALMDADDRKFPYSVAWIDLLARGKSLGRSVYGRGRFATPDELDARRRPTPFAYDPSIRVGVPALVPGGMLNRASIRAFNEFWFRKAPRARVGEVQEIATFFHPLDMIRHWNRLYGPRGFLQYQLLVPFGAEDVLRRIVERVSDASVPTFLAVLKRFGPGNLGPLSFPAPGWTLTMDIPTGVGGLAGMLDEFDDLVAASGGRVYLAKDSRLRPELFATMYPRLAEWQAVRARLDPAGSLQSDLGRRLGLC